MIRWFATNPIAANFLMVAILLAGVTAGLLAVPLEVRPSHNTATIYVSLEYPGGTASDVVREAIAPLETALRDLPEAGAIYSWAYQGAGEIMLEARHPHRLHALLEEVKSRVQTVTTLPQHLEPPHVHLEDTARQQKILSVVVTGALEEPELRRVAQKVQDDLAASPHISRTRLNGGRKYEIAVEADQARLASYDLGFTDLVTAIRSDSLNLPAGAIASESGTITIRTAGQAYTIADFKKIPIRGDHGSRVLLQDVATIQNGLAEEQVITRFNQRPAVVLDIYRLDGESALEVAAAARAYVDNASTQFPQGIRLFVWGDESKAIQERLQTLGWSLVQGGLLVFLLLSLFLRPRLAFWVVMGIPVSFAGGVLLMPFLGLSANIISLFAFILVLGLVVDDAIVTGENIHSLQDQGLPPLRAAIEGTQQVAVPVTFGVMTTIAAFIPLLFFEGQWGPYARQIPLVVAPVLLFSLIESKLILPAHLATLARTRPSSPLTVLQLRTARILEQFVTSLYQPLLQRALQHRYTVLAVFAAGGLALLGYCQGGRLGFIAMPTVDRPQITATLEMPPGTSVEDTRRALNRIAGPVKTLQREFIDHATGEPLVNHLLTTLGGHFPQSAFAANQATARLEVLSPSSRSQLPPRNSVVANRWRELLGPFPQARSLVIRGHQGGEGGRVLRSQEPIQVELRGPNSEAKARIAQEVAKLLESYHGISVAWTSLTEETQEFEITLKSQAVEWGLTHEELARQLRQAFHGEEAQRILRGRDDLRVTVRLPRKDRRSLHTLDQLHIRTPSDNLVPLTTLADVTLVSAPAFIERRDAAEVIDVFAHPEDESVDIVGIARQASSQIATLLRKEPALSFRYLGYIAEHQASKKQTWLGAIALAVTLFFLLAIPFKSLIQPLYILAAVPFGIIGALLGHLWMGVTPSYLSIFGMLAMAGVVVNDSLVMVDFINRRAASGTPITQAIVAAGGARFRAIFLTSLTTFAGLTPILLDDSSQAQFLAPMAVSLGYGVLFATGITLLLIPCIISVGEDLRRLSNVGRLFVGDPYETTPALDPSTGGIPPRSPLPLHHAAASSLPDGGSGPCGAPATRQILLSRPSPRISFDCFFCHTSLTVAASQAGIAGPCPRCGTTLTSPVRAAPDSRPQPYPSNNGSTAGDAGSSHKERSSSRNDAPSVTRSITCPACVCRLTIDPTKAHWPGGPCPACGAWISMPASRPASSRLLTLKH